MLRIGLLHAKCAAEHVCLSAHLTKRQTSY
nr:MAG TPA_asm: hypothetical protein [Caudoviricetes sp.]DAT34951.1 MAG TPA: hypothetical protein [Caudoviricetes sp.]